MTVHPAAQPAIDALLVLRQYEPASPADLAALLASIHGYRIGSIIPALLEALEVLADGSAAIPDITPTQIDGVRRNLGNAVLGISGAADDYISRAREDAKGGA